jgi:tagaturonate reductase
LRLLNGTHTLSSGIAFLAGIDTVKQAMDDTIMEKYIAQLMQYEIGPSIPYEIDSDTVQNFIKQVLERFRNPYINHYWKNITLNYTSKMKLRCIPLLINYYKKNNSVPELFAMGFASYIYFMKAVKQDGNEFFGEFNGNFYLINDEMAEKYYKIWQNLSADKVVKEVLKNIVFWDEDLSILPDFEQSVTDKLNSIINNGMRSTIENGHPKKIAV